MLKMELKLMAISRKEVFFQTLINEIDCTLHEMQFFKGMVFIGVSKFFSRICLKRLRNLSAWVKNRVAYKKICMRLKMNKALLSNSC